MTEFHTIDLNNIQFHYAEAPGPEPPLVILHGLTGSHAEFLHLVPELARQTHVYALDLRGHGLSGWGAGAYQIADYGCDVAAFLRQVVGRPALMVGHSLGGLVAVWLATHTPELLSGLVLEDPGLYILQMPRFGQSVFYGYFVNLYDYLKRDRANGPSLEEIIVYIGQTPVDEEHTWLEVAGPQAVRERAIQLHQLDPAILEPALNISLLDNHEPDHLLAQISCPVHLVAAQSTLGGALTLQDVQRAVSHIPHCTHTIIENAGHDIHLDQPEAFMRELKRFLMRVQVPEL